MAYLDPFEIINQRVLPAFRRELVLELSKTIPRGEIAKALELTPVAVHYYLKRERGNTFEFTAEELTDIQQIAKDFVKSKDVFLIKTSFKRLVDSLFKNKRLCGICKGENCNCNN